jgi:hypothetical protein
VSDRGQQSVLRHSKKSTRGVGEEDVRSQIQFEDFGGVELPDDLLEGKLAFTHFMNLSNLALDIRDEENRQGKAKPGLSDLQPVYAAPVTVREEDTTDTRT